MKIGPALSISAALLGSLVVNAALFTFLPVAGYLGRNRGIGAHGEVRELQLTASSFMPKKKEKPKARESLEAAHKTALEPGKNLARQRFVMDLGSGGGSGAVSGGAGVSEGDLKQASYAEGETDVDAHPISQLAPRKPKKAEAAGAGGLVRCLLTVGEDGKVAEVQFLEIPGDYGFEEAVRQAVAEWRYQPATVGGVPVKQRIEQPFKF